MRRSPVVELRLLGPLQIRATDERELDGLARRSKRAALLAYLAAATPRGFHRRDTLLNLFWSESDEAHARASLNQALYVLRSALGQGAIATRGDGEVGLGDVVWCDAVAFDAALEAGRPAEALGLYRGDLLAGFFVAGAPEFERWLDRERGRFRQRASDGAWALAEAEAAEGRVLEAERWARRAADLLPADEAVTRRMMTFLRDHGDRAAAIRAYEAFVWQLAKDYDLQPSAETEALAAAIRREDQRSSTRIRAAHRDLPGREPERRVATPFDGSSESAAWQARNEPNRPRLRTAGLESKAPALRARWMALGLATLVALGGLGWLHQRSGDGSSGGGLPRVVVLPFENLGPADEQYFADGITDEITGRLAQISGLRVISRTSARHYADGSWTVREIGRELGVGYVLEGTIRTDSSSAGAAKVRVTSQLIRVADDVHIWSGRYTVTPAGGELFRIQADIAERVAQALDVTLSPGERRLLATRRTDQPHAYDYYLRGNDYYHRGFNERDTRIALQMYERAIMADSGFALAYAKLGQAHAQMYWFSYDRSPRRLAEAKRAVDRALKLDPDLPEAHIALGYYHYWGRLAYDQALTAFRRALALQPNNTEVLEGIGGVRRRQGAFADAIESYGRVLQLDPRSARAASLLGATYALQGDAAQALHYFDRVISLAPEFALPYRNKAQLHLSEGSTRDARAVLESPHAPRADPLLRYYAALVELFDRRYETALDRIDSLPSDAFEDQWQFVPKAQLRAHVYELLDRADLGRVHYDSARLVAEAQLRIRPDDASLHSALGIAYAGLGRKEEAVHAAERGVALLPVTSEAWRGLYRIEALARVYVILGDHDAALDELERLLALPGGHSLPFLSLDPIWDPLRDSSRFQRLLIMAQQRPSDHGNQG